MQLAFLAMKHSPSFPRIVAFIVLYILQIHKIRHTKVNKLLCLYLKMIASESVLA